MTLANRKLRWRGCSDSANLLLYLNGTAPTRGVGDNFKWFKNVCGSYSVSSGNELFSSSSIHVSYGEDTLTTFRLIWKTLVPSKVQVFGWRCVRDKLATSEQLARRGILTDSRDKVCVFCFLEFESLPHLLLSCPFSRIFWVKFQLGSGWLWWWRLVWWIIFWIFVSPSMGNFLQERNYNLLVGYLLGIMVYA